MFSITYGANRKAELFVYSMAIILAGCLIFAVVIGTDTPIIIISGTSMTPTLSSGDIVLLYRPHISELVVNDIIAFKKFDNGGDNGVTSISSIVVHRIVDINAENGLGITLDTQGDFNVRQDDNAVTESNYVGKAYLLIPKVGILLSILKNPLVILSLVSTVAAYIITKTMSKRNREGKKIRGF